MHKDGTALEDFRAELKDIASTALGLSFEENKEKFISLCRQLRFQIESAQAGHEFDDTLPTQFELELLARRLGFHTGPMRTTETDDDGITVDAVDVYLPFAGSVKTCPIAAYAQEKDKLVGRVVALDDQRRREVLRRLDLWVLAAERASPRQFRPEREPDDEDYRQAMLSLPGELTRLWHLKESGSPKKGSTIEGRRETQMSRAEASAEARQLLSADPTFAGRTQRQWAEEIGCSTGLVSKLPIWHACMEMRKEGRSPKRPKVISLTPKLEANLDQEGHIGRSIATTHREEDILEELVTKDNIAKESGQVRKKAKARRSK